MARAEKSRRAWLALIAAAAVSAPLNASGMLVAAPVKVQPADSEAADDGLVISEEPTIRDETQRLGSSRSIEIRTDACGMPQQFGRPVPMLRQSDDDEDDGDPSDMALELVQQWLSEHPDVAVINDGVAKSCDGDDGEDEGFGPEFEATRPFHPNSLPASRPDAGSIA